MKSLLSDLLLALRRLRQAPGFALTVIAVLALGVGANTAIFSVIRAVLLNPFPYTGADRIVTIGSFPEGDQGMMPVTYPDFLDFRKNAQRFDYIAYATNQNFILTQVAEPATLKGATVSATAWPMLGLAPLLGRTFTEAEDAPGAEPVCVIGASLWQRRFGSDPSILGRSLTLNGRAYTVIGVMPPRFKFWGAEVWVPTGLSADTELMRSRVIRMNAWAVGKLKPGVTKEGGEADLNLIAKHLAEQYPDSNKQIGARVSLLADAVTGPIRSELYILCGAVGFVLLIACANVANLLLSRSAARQREFAIRSALGASRGRLVRQVLIEILPLATFGALAGILVGAWGLDALLALIPPDVIPAEAEIKVNLGVMAFALGICILTMLVFALLPALELTKKSYAGVLQEGGRGSAGPGSARARAGLIVAEVGLSLMLLVGAGLLIRSFAKLQSVNPGFRTENLLVMSIELPPAHYKTGDQATQFYKNLVERLQHLPQVTSVAAASNAPFMGGSDLPLLTPERTYTALNELQSVQFSLVTGDYFSAQGLKLLSGRGFTDADRAGSEPVIVLNEAAVKKFLSGKDPLREQVMLGLPANLITPGLLPPGLDKFQWARVVGVVESDRHFGLQADPIPGAYIPVDQGWNDAIVRNNMFVLLRTSGDPLLVAADARAAVKSLDPDQPVGQISTMEATVADSLRQSRFSAVLLGVFAAVASVLAIVGVYGVVSWNVTQRTRELGIRAALGATRKDLVQLVVGHGMRVVLLGLLVGLAGSFALSRILQNLLFNTSAFDLWTFSVVCGALAVVALVACVIPALRASRADPLEALRAD